MTAGEFSRVRPATPARHPLSKVPEVTVYFWIIKVLTTAMGESTSDFLVHAINPYLAVGIGFVAFAVSMVLQFATRRYVTWIYWLAVAMVAVFGTMTADVLHVALGVPYLMSTSFFIALLAVIFTVWYKAEGTLSIHSIYTPRREVFYWATVVTTFALGTAAGDMTARTVGLGYLGSGIMFTAVIILPAAAYWWLGLNAIPAFWFAYIVTRPVGASFADWLGFPPSVGGAGVGHGPVSLISTLVIACFVAYLAATRKDVASARGADKRAPDRGGPDRGGPDRRGPDRGGPDRRGPDRRGPDRRGPDRRGPDRRGPDRRGPGDDLRDSRGGPTRSGRPQSGRPRTDRQVRSGQPDTGQRFPAGQPDAGQPTRAGKHRAAPLPRRGQPDHTAGRGQRDRWADPAFGLPTSGSQDDPRGPADW